MPEWYPARVLRRSPASGGDPIASWAGGRRIHPIAILIAVRGVLLAIKADLGCLLVSLLFLIIMASTIVFATILTPPAHNPYV